MDLSPFKARIQELGYGSVLEFFAANPGVPYGILYRKIAKPVEGKGYRDISFLMLEEAHRRGAAETGLIREYAMDTLVRLLREHLRGGWSKGKNSSQGRDRAFSHWLHERTRLDPRCKKVWAALNELNPPPDWSPESPSDPLIEKAFEIGWPVGQVQESPHVESMTGTLIEVIDRLDEVDNSGRSNSPTIIYAEGGSDALPTARAIVCPSDEEGTEVCPKDPALRAVLMVESAKAAIEVWSVWRSGRTPSPQEKFAAVMYYSKHHGFMPNEATAEKTK